MAKERYNKKGRNLAIKESADTKLVIPKKLSPEELIYAVENHVQGMSKKKRKRLEKFVEKKNKKLRRAELLEDLKHSSVVDTDLKKTSQVGQKEKKDKPQPPIASVEEGSDVIIRDSNIVRILDMPVTSAPPIYNKATDNSQFDLSTKRSLDPGCVLGQAEKLDFKQTRSFKIPKRSDTINAIRDQLPIIQHEHDIMEELAEKDVVVVCGATGSGKSTQVSQFCWEYGYSMSGIICCTQPRQVAAITLANRVQVELQNASVGYKVRHNSNVNKDTEIVYMTDGILLKEMMSDVLLLKYSVIVIDESHERSINTDVLIGLLSRIVKLRRNKYEKKECALLKLIIMSATMRIHDFTENLRLFEHSPPVVDVPARIHPIILHHNRITPTDYVSAAVDKTIHIHESYPDGSILVFLSGQREVELACQMLNDKYGDPFSVPHPKLTNEEDFEVEELEFLEYEKSKVKQVETDDEEPIQVIGDLTEQEKEELTKTGQYGGQVVVLPLFSILSAEEQAKCFLEYPGKRVIVVATNIAETSITIPNIKYIVDSGKVKNKNYDKASGMYQFKVEWTSKASADQRMGRCGRTSPGNCFRLYSSTVFEHQFIKYSAPEIINMPIENVILHLKAIGIDNIVNFPFPTAPSQLHIQQGLKLLKTIKALDKEDKLTPDGLLMSKFPVNARFSRILISCLNHHCLRYAVTIIAILSTNHAIPIQNYMNLKSQLFNKLFAVCGLDFEDFKRSTIDNAPKAIKEIRMMREQLVKMLNKILTNGFEYDMAMGPPSLADLQKLKKAILDGFLDNVAVPYNHLNNADQLPLTNIYSLNGLKCQQLKAGQNEMIVYSDVVNNFANNATIMPLSLLGPQCIHLASHIELIKAPMPTYTVKQDEMLGYISIDLPNTSFKPLIFQSALEPHFDVSIIQKHLMMLLLNGDICEPFKSMKKYLITQPNVFINSSVYVSKAINVLQLVKKVGIYNLKGLSAEFEKNPLFLLSELLMFYKDTGHQILRGLWPPFKYENGKIEISAHNREIIKKL